MPVSEWSHRWKRNDDFPECLHCKSHNTKEHHFVQVPLYCILGPLPYQLLQISMHRKHISVRHFQHRHGRAEAAGFRAFPFTRM